MRVILLIFLLHLVSAKVFYTDKDDEQSVPLPLNSDRIRIFQEKILGILGLQRPDPNKSANADEFASKFMSALYELMTEESQNKEDDDISHVLEDIGKESRAADTIVSFIPDEIRASEESFSSMFEAVFSVKSLKDDGEMIAARLFIVLENLPTASTTPLLRVFRKTISSELVEIGSQTLANYGQLAIVSLNVTQLVEHWLSNQQPFPAHQKIYLELNSPNGTAIEISKLKNLHCFGVGLFIDKPKEKRIRRSLPIDLEGESVEQQFSNVTDNSTLFENSTPFDNATLSDNTTSSAVPRRFDRISGNKDKKCGLRSLYVDFKDLGWSDWVFAPQGYYADFCSGDCGFPLDNTVLPLNHAIIQTLVHILDKRRAPEAKCAPAELLPQYILILDNQKNLIMKKYQNMRVNKCGCR